MRQIVADVSDPVTEISLQEAQDLYGDDAEVDMEIEFPKPTDVLGRIAAQTAKQVIFQKVREAERDNVYAEFSDRLGRGRVGHGQALRERRHLRGGGPGRGHAAAARAVAGGVTTQRATASAP